MTVKQNYFVAILIWPLSSSYGYAVMVEVAIDTGGNVLSLHEDSPRLSVFLV